MSLRRVGGLAAMALATLLWMSCGEVFRPVVLPTTLTPPNPANFHAVFAVNVNAPFNPGTAMQIDVSGDTDIGVANMGVNPTHAASLPNNSRVFVASAGSGTCPPGTDVITSFAPAIDSTLGTGLGSPATFSLPVGGTAQSSGISSIIEVGNTVTVTLSSAVTNAATGVPIEISGVGGSAGSPYNGCFSIISVNGTQITYTDPTAGLAATSGGIATVPVSCPYLPDFVATSQNTAVYAASFGAENGMNCGLASTDSVAMLNPTTNAISNITYGTSTNPIQHPVAMVETPNAENLYVLNQGNSSVIDLSPLDLSPITPSPIAVGNMPVWAAVRPDGQRLYVVTQGDGQLYTINTVTNALVQGSPQSVGGAGANFVLYDSSLNRLYVTNPTAGAAYVFNATTDPPTPMGSATGVVSIPAPSPCATAGACSPVMPVSVAALPDGSRFYVASYATATGGCPDPTVSASGCIIPQVTVFDAASLTLKTTVFPLLASASATSASGFALTPVSFCAPVIPYTPANARFRMFAAAATDSSRVYASMCDGGTVAIINTTTSTVAVNGNAPDTLVTDLATPFSAAPAGPSGQPPTQNPVFLLTGQ
jgi:hypothetical protein